MTRLHVPVPVRWSDLDAYEHVNNARMLTLLEEARIAAFWSDPAGGAPTAVLETGPGSPSITLVAAQRIEYLAPIPFHREPLDVELWIGRLGGASLEVCYEIYSPPVAEPRTLYTRAASTIVLVDRATGAPRRLGDEVREAWQPYVEPPIAFRD
ncbi:MAG: acyl-CoA thioesterase [Actinobacteria bacterium]|nr:acyl-CoA thioesterase [Actinomycetota bacterium]MBU1608467.1 acyl-CoA thioesterase [Actinomycetota bacterium]MBU2316707.1 acyl-CoA thioesterase [Actinomycetota bacterium]MBU2385455.1 acyl-CoA thioesterase [Actinomycetota bacterium]